MEAAPTAELVYQGICTLFHNSNPKEKEKANKWLEDFQKSIYSWTIADELLQQKRDLHSCYFAAQTMRNKIQNSFNELPPSSHESLRDSLIVHIGQITNDTDAVIVTQLSLAVADLALLMAAWKQPIIDLLELLSPQAQSVWPLLEILTLLPEEIDSRYLRLGSNRREEIHKQLDAAAPKVLEFLCICLQRSDGHQERLLNCTLRCFSAWVAVQAIPMHHFTENPVGQKVFQLLSSAETSRKLHDTCTECLCALLSCLEASTSRYKLDPTIEAQIFNAVCSLETAYHISVAHEDIDKTMNYCRIFTVLCEAFFYEMLSNEEVPHYSIKGLDLVLMCVGHFDYEVAEITFNLWYRLSEDLFQRYNDKLTSHFKPHIERLLGALYRHAQMDADHDGLIDEHDSFNDFRRKVSDLIKDVAFIVGSGACFKQMFLILQAPNTTWESTESALFIMQNVAKNIIPDENEVIPKVVEAILNLPDNTHIAVRYTSIMLLGELCDWIENHAESLQAVLNFLLYSLQQKNGLAAAAAIALTSICAACRQKMVCHISGLVEIARSLDSFEINNDLAIGLLKGISLILSRLHHTQLETSMREIISFQLQPLALMVESTTATLGSVQKGERTDPAYWIDRACAVIRHTNPDIADGELHPTVQILTDAWPLLSQVMVKYQTDVRIMERTCRLIRYGVRMVRKQASVLVEPLVKQMICIYALHHHSCFLYLGSVLVDEFAKAGECIPGLLEMLKAFIEPTFSMLRVENGLKNNPDTVDDFFRLCSRFIECCPVPFLQSTLVTPIFQCALLACTLDHREANSSVMKFFCNLLKWGRSSNQRHPECRPLVKEIAEQNGAALILNLIHASVYCLHSYMLSDVADVIYELKSVETNEHMHTYISTALDALPKRNSGGYVTATQQQLDDFTAAVLSASTPKTITVALKNFTRLYR
ncbi:transportin-3 isoform X2 [Bactrocera dorsalis]|uniref:Transportin-3 isoform X2 n=1 Tax=Bactrocera dorsalis TaxID=27457 RepID=A0A6I9V5K0_BACDO|nr:transportin-3 isoform X2 [Bactrocera dorsalis]